MTGDDFYQAIKDLKSKYREEKSIEINNHQIAKALNIKYTQIHNLYKRKKRPIDASVETRMEGLMDDSIEIQTTTVVDEASKAEKDAKIRLEYMEKINALQNELIESQNNEKKLLLEKQVLYERMIGILEKN